MHQLHVLGRVNLTDDAGTELRSVLAQPKRLALLAYLALNASNGSCRRDQLLLLFWPELTQDRARNALNKSLHFLRQALGEDTILSRSADEVAVNGARLRCDALEFSDAVSAGRMSHA